MLYDQIDARILDMLKFVVHIQIQNRVRHGLSLRAVQYKGILRVLVKYESALRTI